MQKVRLVLRLTEGRCLIAQKPDHFPQIRSWPAMMGQTLAGVWRISVTLELTHNFKRHTDIFAGVARYAEEHEGFQCIVDDFADRTLAESGQESPYDGVIGRVTPALAAEAGRRELPLVNVWLSSPVSQLVSLFRDSRQAGQLVAEHLLARGIRRFLCLIRRNDQGEAQLAERFQQLVTEAGCHCDLHQVPLRFAHSHWQWKKTRAWIEAWLDQATMPVGAVVGVDLLGRHLAQICKGMGLRVPQDVAIAGGDNEPTVCLYPDPALTSVEYGLDRLGYQAARTLHQMLRGHNVPREPIWIPPRELVVRQSSDFVYVQEEAVSFAMQFIAQHARRSISVDEIAAVVRVSRRTLEQRFARHLGRSVGAEIRRVRVEHAKRLLASSELSCSQIATLVGFGTAQYMARVFGQELRVSPSQYRGQFGEPSQETSLPEL